MAWGVVAQERHVVSCSHMLLLVCVVGRCGAAAHTKPLSHRELPTPAALAKVESPNESLTRTQNPPKPPLCGAPEDRAEYHDARWVAPLSNAVRFALSSRARPGGQVATLACDGCDQDQPARGALRASCASTGEAALLLISFLELLRPLL